MKITRSDSTHNWIHWIGVLIYELFHKCTKIK